MSRHVRVACSAIVLPMMPSPLPTAPSNPRASEGDLSGLGIIPRRAATVREMLAALPPGLVWFLAECHRCGNDFGQPFVVEDDRDVWAAEHLAATGHTVHLVLGEDIIDHIEHMAGVLRRDDNGSYGWLCSAEPCERWHGPYDTAQIAAASWRRHSEGNAK